MHFKSFPFTLSNLICWQYEDVAVLAIADIELPNMQNLVGAQSGSSHPRARGDIEALGRASGSVNNNDDGHGDSDDGHEDDQSNFAIL